MEILLRARFLRFGTVPLLVWARKRLERMTRPRAELRGLWGDGSGRGMPLKISLDISEHTLKNIVLVLLFYQVSRTIFYFLVDAVDVLRNDAQAE